MARQSIDEEPVPSVEPAQNKGRPYVLIGFSLVFIALFIGASLMVKSKFTGGTAAPPTAETAKPVSGLGGHYVGYTTIQTGICSVGAHEMVIDVSEDGNARTDYAMRSSKPMTGRASPDGKLKMNFRDGDYAVRFDGEIKSGHIVGHSTVSGDESCSINWDLYKN